VIRRLVVGVDHRLQLKIHLLQLVPGCMILHNDKGVHDKKSLEEKLLQLQNADDTLDVGVMMFDMNNLKMINDTYGHEEGDVFIETFASYLTRILTEDSFLARFGGGSGFSDNR